MNEIIASILDAEKKAEEIVKNAAEKSKTIRANADIDGEKIKNGAVAVFKVHRASIIKDADCTEETEYDTVFNNGRAQAKEIIKTASAKADAFLEDVVKGIIG